MQYSKGLKTTALSLCGFTSIGLILAAFWSRSASFESLPPWLEVAGNLHPIFLHLPIGIFIYLAAAEVWNFVIPPLFKRGQIPSSFPVLVFGTINAVLAAVAGLMLYLQGDYSGELVEQHLNWGIGFTVSTLVVLSCALIFQQRSKVYKVVLLVSTVSMLVAGHRGGLMTHGDPLEPLFASEAAVTVQQPVELLFTYEVVDKIFESKCYNCHAVDRKQKGGLLMDSYEALLAGGKKGPSLVPGDLENSRLSTYLHLPLDDEYHMPPEGKPQLTDEEIAFIDYWISSGADPKSLLMEQDLPSELNAWALDYLQTTVAPSFIDAPAIIEKDSKPNVDFDALISTVEAHAENSITRVGKAGHELMFSAVNARGKFDDNALKHLNVLAPYLIEVDLSNTQVSANSLHALIQKTPKLKRLNLTGTQVGSSWFTNASDIPQLDSLILFGTPLSGGSIPALSQLKQLRSLYLAETGLSAKQIGEIQEALPECEIISDNYLLPHTPKAPIPAYKSAPASKPTTAIIPSHSAKTKTPSALNLAAGKPVTANSYYKMGTEVFPPTNITDARPADTGTRADWSFWLAENDEAGTITIDLQSMHSVNRVDLQNTRNRNFGDRGLKGFTLQSSTNGQDFKTLLSGELPAVNSTTTESYPFISYNVHPHEARYIRIIGTSHYGNSGGLNEVRVYNAPHSDHSHAEHSHEAAAPASTKNHITGSNGHRYRTDPKWAKFADGAPIGATHGGVAVDKVGNVYVSTDGPRAVSVFDSQGNYLRSFHKRLGGMHSLIIREENGTEYLYGAHLRGQRILKLDLKGTIIQEIKHSEEHPIPGTLKGLTAVAVGPDGRIYAAVGYGSNHMHIFSPEGELLKTVGSHGKANDQTDRNHGLKLDTRFKPARLLVADRENRRLMHYDLEGNFLSLYAENLRRPCSFSIYGEICAVAELQGRVTLLDKSGQVVTHLGDNPDRKQWANFKTPLELLAPNIFSAPHGLSFDNEGNLIVQDWNKSGRLTKLTRIEE